MVLVPICWVKEHQAGDGQAFRGAGKLTPPRTGRDQETEEPGEALADGERHLKKSDCCNCRLNPDTCLAWFSIKILLEL